MDTFVEQIIIRKKTGKDFAILAGILLGGCLLAAGSMIAFMMTGLSIIPMVAIVGICWGGYMLLGMRNIEYEYSFTNGDVTVDKIVNRRSRKRMVSFDCKDVEEMGPYNQSAAGHLESRAFDKRLFCGTADLAENSWYMDAHSKKYGHVLLVFTPNEEVLDGIRVSLPYLVRQQVFGRR